MSLFTAKLTQARAFALFALCVTCCSANATCLPYEPASVSLVGKLERRTFAGPPNYESIAQGDKRETGFYLVLRSPVCSKGIAGSANPESFKNVGLVQLILDRQGYDKYRPKLNHTIRVTGTLSSWITGHHHTPLLLQVAHGEGAVPGNP